MAVFSLCAIEEAQADAAFDRQVASLGQVGQQAPADIAKCIACTSAPDVRGAPDRRFAEACGGDAVLAAAAMWRWRSASTIPPSPIMKLSTVQGGAV
jgi:hypothetical protein